MPFVSSGAQARSKKTDVIENGVLSSGPETPGVTQAGTVMSRELRLKRAEPSIFFNGG